MIKPLPGVGGGHGFIGLLDPNGQHVKRACHHFGAPSNWELGPCSTLPAFG